MIGSDIDSAYAPFNSDKEVISPFLQDAPYTMDNTQQHQSSSSHEIQHKSTPIINLGNSNQQMQNIPTTQTQPQFTSPVVSAQNSLAMQGTQDPRIAVLLNELKKQQRITASMQQQSGYLDKLFAKKKDLLKILQFSLIIVLALSLHFIIDYYMKYYISNNDLSFERELVIRILYPIAIIFILWNMKAFLK